MKLTQVMAQYVTHKQSMGMRFHTEARILKSFCRTLGDIPLAEVAPDQVQAYLAGTGPVTRFWHRKHQALLGFYRFALGRGYAASCPLPKTLPKPPQSFVPYIFSPDELRRLIEAAARPESPRRQLQAPTFRTLLFLLYGTGLRISEGLSLRLADVDLSASLLTIRESKFYKMRLVPIGPSLSQVLASYTTERQHPGDCPSQSSPFFLTRRGTPVTRSLAESAFRRLCNRAGVRRHDGARYQPRLHDLRHCFAVNRLVAWYREGADVQRLLPHLSTYLGHLHVAATQRYLTLTPELLREAGLRFQQHALAEVPHE